MRQEGRQFGRGQERPRPFVIGNIDGDINQDEQSTEAATVLVDDIAAGRPLIPGTPEFIEAMTEEATVTEGQDSAVQEKTPGQRVLEQVQQDSHYDSVMDVRAYAAEGSVDAAIQVEQALNAEKALIAELQSLSGQTSEESKQKREELFSAFVKQRKIADAAITHVRTMMRDGSIADIDIHRIQNSIAQREALGMSQREPVVQQQAAPAMPPSSVPQVQQQRRIAQIQNETVAQRQTREHAEVSAEIRRMEDLSEYTGIGGWFKKTGIRAKRFFGQDEPYNALVARRQSIRDSITKRQRTGR